MKRNSLSIVLPIHNAADRLATLVAEGLALAAHHSADYELILALDGADEATERQAISLAATHAPVALLRSPQRRGFYATLWNAWGAARGDLILAIDHQQVAVAEAAKLLAAADGHALVLAYRLPAPVDLSSALAIIAPSRAAREPRDPTLRLFLVQSELRDLLASPGPGQLVGRELFHGARRRGLPLAQVAVAGKTRGGVGADQRHRATVGVGMLIVAGALWMLRRWLPNGRQ